MANKLAFRARAPDAAKPLPIYHVDELPDLAEAAINRAVPPMPTGMEKNEECEHHLLKAISARQKYGETGDKDSEIPIPDVMECPAEYESIYARDSTVPKPYIHVPPFSLEPSKPDYDLDSEDEEWFVELKRKDHTFEDFTELEFEEMIDRLEKGSGQTPVTLKEARMLLNQDDDLIVAVHTYWMEKRARYLESVSGKFDKTGAPMIPPAVYPVVLTSVPPGSAPNNPYVAFRKRTEKMQTRKNRKNDEFAYEKMVKLRRDLMKAITLLEMVKRREKLKREYLNLTVEIVDKRYQLNDWKGEMLMEVLRMKTGSKTSSNSNRLQALNRSRSAASHRKIAPVNDGFKHQLPQNRLLNNRKRTQTKVPPVDESFKFPSAVVAPSPISSTPPKVQPPATTELRRERITESVFAFKRRPGCKYAMPVPLSESRRSKEAPPVVDPFVELPEGDRGVFHQREQFHMSSLRFPKSKCLGFTRRRIGRGGRVLLDRLETTMDGAFAQLPWQNGSQSVSSLACDNVLADGEQFPRSQLHLLNEPHYAPAMAEGFLCGGPGPSTARIDVDSSSSDEDHEMPSVYWGGKQAAGATDGEDNWGLPGSAPYARQYLLPWSMTFGGCSPSPSSSTTSSSSEEEDDDENETHREEAPVFPVQVSINFDPIALDDVERMLEENDGSKEEQLVNSKVVPPPGNEVRLQETNCSVTPPSTLNSSCPPSSAASPATPSWILQKQLMLGKISSSGQLQSLTSTSPSSVLLTR